jgi:uncharacterized protein YbjT (DUF2867 family)
VSKQLVAVFGGTGFLGRRIVRHLREAGFDVRIASRHPDRVAALFSDDNRGIEPVRAYVNNDASVAAAVTGAFAVVNTVSLYVERGEASFHSVHVEAAGRVASLAQRAGAQRLAHISGIGADARSPSRYIRSRGEGEVAVSRAFPSATLVRPAVMFGSGDAFVVPLLRLLRRLPAFPLFGNGETILQPAYVEDVGKAVAHVLQAPAAEPVYELAGPRVYTYAALLRTIGISAGKRPFLIPLPFALWSAIAYMCETLPSPPITTNQVELMERDNAATAGVPGFAALGIIPQALENTLPEILQNVEQSEQSSRQSQT